jgi:hypothetical protein
MNIPLITVIYGAVLHVCSVAVLTVLIALGKGPVDAEWALLTALITAAVTLPVTINPVPSTKPVAAVDAPAA